MKLLLDENLSHRLVARLECTFPATASVNQVGLQSQPDIAIWAYAAEYGFAIVSKDEDLRQLSLSLGHPPKVVWLDVGNAGTDRVADLLLRSENRIATFFGQAEESLLTLNMNDLDAA